MNAKLCATVTGATTTEVRANRDRAVGADLVELRLDYADTVDIDGVLADRRVPVIVTCRPVWAGGRFAGSEEERHRLLSRALALGAEYVDVEWGGRCADLVETDRGRRTVLSDHDFQGIPDDVEERFTAMQQTGASVVKIAVSVTRLSDLVRLRDLSRRNRIGTDGSRVVIGMGAAGLPSRLLPDLFGSAWTYAGTGVAPGQVGLTTMLEEYRIRRATTATRLSGVFGSPLEHSLSPVMHNAGFAAAGHDAVYVPLQAKDIEDFECFAEAFDVQGASVTAPFKEAVMTERVMADDVAHRVGAVNTLRKSDAGWDGRNTDVAGFLAPLEGVFPLAGCRATIVGAGGAARAVAVALSSRGAAVTVSARNQERAAAVATLAGGTTGRFPPGRMTWDLLVNTTPVGTFPGPDVTPVPATDLDGRVVYDLVYNPARTRLLSDAAAAGCTVIGGLGMLVAQAERQFAWWTGAPPVSGTFLAAAERRLGSPGRHPHVAAAGATGTE